MNLRRDALCAAAEFILAVERCGVTATVGEIDAQPGASNVIPSHVALSLDVRHPYDARRRTVLKSLRQKAHDLAKRRGLRVRWIVRQETASVTCDRRFTSVLKTAIARHQSRVLTLASGAGHDAAALATLCPVAMLFVRCKGGVSHHPAESVKPGDVATAMAVLHDFVIALAQRHA